MQSAIMGEELHSRHLYSQGLLSDNSTCIHTANLPLRKRQAKCATSSQQFADTQLTDTFYGKLQNGRVLF